MNNSADYMMTSKRSSAKELRRRGLEKLKTQWGIAVLAFFLASLLFGTACVAALGGGTSFRLGGMDLNLDFDLEDAEGENAGGIGTEDANVAPKEFFGEGGEWQEMMKYPVFTILGVVAGLAMVFSLLLSCLVGGPITLGYNKMHLQLADGEEIRIGTLFSYFKKCFGRAAGLRLLHTLIVSVIPLCSLALAGLLGYWYLSSEWETLLQLPDMNAFAMELLFKVLAVLLLSLPILLIGALLNMLVTYRFAFAYTILAEYPEMRAVDALSNSARLMKGNKWRLFCLDLSFIGWSILCAMSCGIGYLLLGPYRSAAFAELYGEVANRSAANEVEFPSLNPEDYFPSDAL